MDMEKDTKRKWERKKRDKDREKQLRERGQSHSERDKKRKFIRVWPTEFGPHVASHRLFLLGL